MNHKYRLNIILRAALLITLLITLLSTNVSAASSADGFKPSNNMIFSRIGKAPKVPAFEQDGYWVWGSSVIKADDGKYHMYVARWPKYLTFHPGWG